MAKYSFTTAFEPGDDVYHKTPDSPRGIIVDINFSVVSGVQYKVAFDHQTDSWCHEHELSEGKTF